MTTRTLNKRESLDLVIGAKILANGGGGSDSRAIAVINEIYDQEKEFRIASLSDFHKDDYICIIGEVGGGISADDLKIVENMQAVQENPMQEAIHHLERFLNAEFRALVATELGPGNSIVPLMVAAQMDKVAIDGDCCGRSKPKISISTTTVTGIPISPFAVASRYGDIIIVKETLDDFRGEILARTIARACKGSISVARCPMRIAEARQAIIPGSLSYAITIGQAVREANERGMNPIKAIEHSLPDIKQVFIGQVTDFSRVEESGFTSGEIKFESREKSDVLRVFFQNEYLLSWFNDQPFVTCPDSLIVVDASTGYGLTPWEDDFEEGRQVAIFCRDAPAIWHSERGLQVFGPHLFDEHWPEYKKASSFFGC